MSTILRLVLILAAVVAPTAAALGDCGPQDCCCPMEEGTCHEAPPADQLVDVCACESEPPAAPQPRTERVVPDAAPRADEIPADAIHDVVRSAPARPAPPLPHPRLRSCVFRI